MTAAGTAPWWFVAAAGVAGLLVGELAARRLATGGYRRQDERHLPLPPHRVWVPILYAVVWTSLAWRLGAAGHLAVLPAYLYLGALGVALAAIDADVHRLPDALVLPSYPAAAVLLAAASIGTGDWWALGRALVAGAALWVLYLVLALASPGGLGFGDVKLAGVLGLFLGWLGWGAVLGATFLAFILGGLAGVALLALRRVTRRSHIAFGPAMLAGAWLAICVPVQLLTGQPPG